MRCPFPVAAEPVENSAADHTDFTDSKRYSNHYQLQVSYTLGKAIDDTTDFITDLQPANQLDM